MLYVMDLINEVARKFCIYGEPEKAEKFGTGHINNTFRSLWNQAGTPVRYTHQRINEKVFIHPGEVMDNIVRVTGHIAKKLAEAGENDRSRRVLSIVPARDGKPYARDSEGGWWRTYLFIEGAHSLELASSPGEALILGKSIGKFQKQLADLGGKRLHESIPDFHHMGKRYKKFYEALSKDAFNRAKEVKAEIDFLAANEERGSILINAMKDGKISERICHNDAKMNNILIDDVDLEARCVVDLDTVMPGTSLFDTGDLIRTVPSTAKEDERDISKVSFSLPLFKSLMEGYLSESKEFLGVNEKKLLVESGRNITQIMGLRMLTDYLEGDHYYHTERPGQNMDRARNQIALIKSLDSQWEEAEKIVLSLLALNNIP
jgi:thiamine kinase-like enzyme